MIQKKYFVVHFLSVYEIASLYSEFLIFNTYSYLSRFFTIWNAFFGKCGGDWIAVPIC